MSNMDTDTREALEESLYDLKHDLGKYILLPVSMLPDDATREAVAAQTRRAILQTVKGPRGELSAAALFEKFALEWKETLASFETYREVERSVAAATALLDELAQKGPVLTRARAAAVLGEVSCSIQRLMDEVLND
jgi:hypothetical protein